MVNDNLGRLDCLLSQIGLTNSMTFEPSMTALEYLGILTQLIKETNARIDEIPIVPLICGEWADHYMYRPYSLVSYNNDTYISIKSVPQRIHITNKEYWLKISSFDVNLNKKIEIFINTELPDINMRQKNVIYGKITEKKPIGLFATIGIKEV